MYVHKKKGYTLTILTVFLLLSFVSQAYAVNWHFPTDINIPEGVKYHFGDVWVKSIGTSMKITTFFESNWFNYTATGGTQYIHNGTKPIRVYFNNVDQIEGVTWTYSDGTVTISPSGTDVSVTWAGLGFDADFAQLIFKTSSNNAQFGFDSAINIGSGTDFYLYRVRVNSTHLWLDKTYSAKHYTEYCIYATSPNNVQFLVDSWFPTKNSKAQLRINAPLSTNINLGFHSPNLISASATGVVSQTWYSANKTLLMVANSDVNPIIISVTVTETLEENTPPENYDVIITDMEGTGAWVFSEESYYTFQAQYWDGDGWAELDTCKIAFTDGVTWVNASYDVSANEYTLESGSDIAWLKAGSMTIQDSYLIQVTFLIYFRNRVLDAYDVDIWMWCNDTYGAVDGWEVMAANYFSIYNLGGHSTLTSSGNAGRLAGGDVFDLYAYNQSWAKATIAFRNLQHLKLLPMVHFKLTYDISPYFELVYQVEYCVDDVWLEGYKIKMRNGMAGYLGTGSERHVGVFAEWYNHGELIKTDKVYFYHTGLTDENTTYQYWMDLWFNRQNASSIAGGRVNAYYYPMTNTAHEWLRWLTGSNWASNESKRKQSMFFEGMIDNDRAIVHTQQIDMVRVSFLLNCSITEDEYCVIVSDHDVFDITIGGEPFTGIQTPVFDETKIPLMPQGGFLGAVVSWFQGAIKWLADNLMFGGLNLFGNFVAFMDTIASWLGYPNAFSNLIEWLSSFWSWMLLSFGWLISLLTDTFNFLSAFMGKLINTTSTALGIWTNMFGWFFFMLDTGYGYTVGTWEMLGLTTWVMLFFILYPVYLLYIWDDRGIDAVISHIKGVIDIFAFIGTIIIRVIQLTLNIIGRIVESIPVVE